MNESSCEKMAQELSLHYSCSSDETESSDEVFVFSGKRKANSFFIDLTDDKLDAKKQKTAENVVAQKPSGSAECPADSEAPSTSKCAVPLQDDIEIVKVVPPKAEAGQIEEEVEFHEVKSEIVSFEAVTQMSVPKLFSPPRVVRVTSAQFVKLDDVIDLMKASQGEKSTIPMPDGGQIIEVETEDSPNQLGDKNARAAYDAIWFGKLFPFIGQKIFG